MKREINSLKKSFILARLDRFILLFHQKMVKDAKRDIRRLLLLIVPLLASIILGITVFPISIMLAIYSVYGCFLNTVIFLRNESEYEGKKLFSINQNSKTDTILEDDLNGINHTHFYKESSLEHDDDKIVYEEKDNTSIILSERSMAIQRLLEEKEVYASIYTIPSFELTEEQLKGIFNKIYDTFILHQKESHFYETMSNVMQYVYSFALLNQGPFITVMDLVNGLKFLNGELTTSEIGALQKEILVDFKINLNERKKENKSFLKKI